jgi:hypothetical protein
MSKQKPASGLKEAPTISGPGVFGNLPDHKNSFKAPFPDKPAEGPFPFAYAIIEGPPGKWAAVCLEGVTAREIVRLEPNGEPEAQVRAMRRINNAIEMRTIAKKWSKP